MIRTLLALTVFVASILSGCGPGPETSEIRIGSILALSGPNKSFGVTQQRGFEMALDDINKSGGINGKPLRIEYADSRLDEDQGAQVYKKLTIGMGIKAIVGVTGSGVALKLAPSATRDHVVLISSLNTSPKLTTDGGPFFFRNIASDAFAGKVVVDWAVADNNERAVVVYNSENAWARGCVDSIRSATSQRSPAILVGEPIAVLDSTDDFGGVISSFKSQSPGIQAVFLCLMGRQAGLFVKQAQENSLSVTFYGTDSLSQKEFIDNARSGAESAKFVMPGEGNSDAYQKFSAAYQARYGEQADTVAAKAYDALLTFAAAMREAKLSNVDGVKLRDALHRVQYEGVTGLNSFDKNGDLEHPLFDKFTYRDLKMVRAD